MLDSIWSLFQQSSMNAGDTASAGSEGLQSQVDTLILANQAMWEILAGRLDVSEGELVKKMNEIDLRDGKLDGKITKQAVNAINCPDCGHKIAKKRANCYWCGTKLQGESLFVK